jgi:3D (Asp-Asp-Asp) domain-containing protein
MKNLILFSMLGFLSLIMLPSVSIQNVAYGGQTEFSKQVIQSVPIVCDLVDTTTIIVTATMYNPIPSQCDSDPLVTAGNLKINPNKASEQRYIALSRNLLKRWNGKFNYGDRIRLSNCGHKDGIYIVADTMNKRFKNRIDILETQGTPIYKFDRVQLQKA